MAVIKGNQQVIIGWIEKTDRAIAVLQEWRDKLDQWSQQGCDRNEFRAGLTDLRSALIEMAAWLNDSRVTMRDLMTLADVWVTWEGNE